MKPFNLLLKDATKGPFYCDFAGEDESTVIYRKLTEQEAGPGAVSALFEAYWGTYDDARLVARLLNFAHGGGFDKMFKATAALQIALANCQSMTAESLGKLTAMRLDAEHALADLEKAP